MIIVCVCIYIRFFLVFIQSTDKHIWKNYSCMPADKKDLYAYMLCCGYFLCTFWALPWHSIEHGHSTYTRINVFIYYIFIYICMDVLYVAELGISII